MESVLYFFFSPFSSLRIFQTSIKNTIKNHGRKNNCVEERLEKLGQENKG